MFYSFEERRIAKQRAFSEILSTAKEGISMARTFSNSSYDEAIYLSFYKYSTRILEIVLKDLEPTLILEYNLHCEKNIKLSPSEKIHSAIDKLLDIADKIK